MSDNAAHLVIKITPYSDLARQYTLGLGAVGTFDELREFGLFWSSLAPDAAEVISRMKAGDFAEFRSGLDAERRRNFAGLDWAARYGAIIMPALLVRVTMLAGLFGVPWGAAFIRCQQTGLIKRRGHVYEWQAGRALVNGE